ncbi:uncharacterized protein LOC144765829 [Lissotriton helveticus]
MGWHDRLTLATPLWASERLGLLGRTKGFRNWDLIGISRIGDLWDSNGVKLFPSLQSTYELADTEYFRYLQVRHSLQENIPQGTVPPPASPLKDRLLDGHIQEHAISLVYKKLINNLPDLLHDLKRRREADGLEIDEEEWRFALASPKEVAISSRLRLIQLKILHRVYISNTRLKRMGRSESDECRRGCGMIGSLFHMLWECPVLQAYWVKVVRCMRIVWGKELRPELRFILPTEAEYVGIINQKEKQGEDLHKQTKEIIVRAQEKQQENFKKRVAQKYTPCTFTQGQSVLLKNSRRSTRKGGVLEYKFTGPYTILEIQGKRVCLLNSRPYKSSDISKSLKEATATHEYPKSNPIETLLDENEDLPEKKKFNDGELKKHASKDVEIVFAVWRKPVIGRLEAIVSNFKLYDSSFDSLKSTKWISDEVGLYFMYAQHMAEEEIKTFIIIVNEFKQFPANMDVFEVR